VSGTVHIGDTRAANPSARRGKSFPRTAKLLKHPCFDAVYKGGLRHFSGLMTVFFLRRDAPQASTSNEVGASANGLCSAGPSTRRGRVRDPFLHVPSGPRVGFTVGRVLGGSVERNRIRRRMREAVRLNLDLLSVPVDVVINPKKAVLTAEFPRIVEEVRKAFGVIEKKVGSL
jgi:ribonuclease P protein component